MLMMWRCTADAAAHRPITSAVRSSPPLTRGQATLVFLKDQIAEVGVLEQEEGKNGNAENKSLDPPTCAAGVAPRQ